MSDPTCKQRGPIALAGTSEPESTVRSRPNEPKPARRPLRPNEPTPAGSALPQPPCSACRSSSRAMMLRWIWFVPS
jgi:hypothetical protein